MKLPYRTNCLNCKKDITVITKTNKEIYTCNGCVPEDSGFRNGIDEAIETETSNVIFKLISKILKLGEKNNAENNSN